MNNCSVFCADRQQLYKYRYTLTNIRLTNVKYIIYSSIIQEHNSTAFTTATVAKKARVLIIQEHNSIEFTAATIAKRATTLTVLPITAT